MHTDLFLALLEKGNPRGHPLLAALLYAFCPAAARWWLAGADPVLPFDPLWQALEDRVSGKTLKEALSSYGFENLVKEAQTYVGQVDNWRKHHPGIHAPELMPTFSGGRIKPSQRFEQGVGIRKFGNRWENIFAYVRAWVFVVQDWEVAIRLFEPSLFFQTRLALTLPGIRRGVTFPAFAWTGKVKAARRVIVGLIGGHDPLRLGMVQRANLSGDKPWPSPPEVWALDGIYGRAHHFKDRLPENALPAVIEQLAHAAQVGPHPPLKALKGADLCPGCGFRAQCFTDQGEISELSIFWRDNAYSRIGSV